MRYTKRISTGKLIETQGGGNPDNPVHLATLKDNAIASGIAEADIEVGYEDDDVVAGWLKKEEDDALTYADKRKAEYGKLNQFEMQFDDQRDSTSTWVDAVNAIKSQFPKPS